MALEKRWKAVPARPFTSDGTTGGLVTIASTRGFYVKQTVYLKNNTSPLASILQVKNVVSKTQLVVGLKTEDIKSGSDVSAFTVANAATIEASEQQRPNIEAKEFNRATYEEEPAVAERVILVDRLGEKYDTDNPIPVQLTDGSINIESLNANVSVQLTAKDNDPKAGDVHDSVRIADAQNELAINADGSINVVIEDTLAARQVISQFFEITSVASGVSTSIGTYTVPVGKVFKLDNIEVGGNNIAQYEIYLNGVISARKRTWFSGPFNELFIFQTTASGGYVLQAGDTVQVKVLHNRPALGSFEARISGEITS